MSTASRASVGPYTWDDFIALDEDDLRELIDGELVEVEVPTRSHERVVSRLVFFLTGYTEADGGEVFASGYKVRISASRGVMPDAQLFRADNVPSQDQEQGLIRGRPDLVVEVMSPSSRRYDRIVKLGYYASLRVPEYWLVDPEARVVERLTYSRKGYIITEAVEGDVVLAPASFPGLSIPLARVWPTVPTPPPKRKPSVKRAVGPRRSRSR